MTLGTCPPISLLRVTLNNACSLRAAPELSAGCCGPAGLERMSLSRQKRQAMKGTAEGHTPPAKGRDGKQPTTLGRSCQMHTPRLEDAFYAVIYTARAPGKARRLLLFHVALCLQQATYDGLL